MTSSDLVIDGVRLPRTSFRDVRGVDVDGLMRIEVSRGRIVRIAPAAKIATPDVDVIVGDGRTVFPGLVDAHVHLSFDPARNPEEWIPTASVSELEAIAEENGRATLRAGVTAVRDVGSPGDIVRGLARRIADGQTLGPRVLATGPVLTRRRGHCYFVGDLVEDADDPSRLVDEHRRAGDRWIKIMVTGGALTSTSDPGILQFRPDQVEDLIGRAHEEGLRVAAHVLTAEGARIAVAAGVDSLEHGIGADGSVLDELAGQDGVLVPILSPSARTLERDPAGVSQHSARLRAVVGELQATVERARAVGTTVLVGTDAGCPDVPHGAAVVGEISLLEERGFGRADLLGAATSVGAAALGFPAGLGLLTEGAPADLLLLDGDPLDDLGALRRPTLVVADGIPFDPTASIPAL